MQRALRLALARSSQGVDLDLAEVGFCDCSGLNALLREHPAATHDPTEENEVSDEAEELRLEVVQLKRAMVTRPVIDLARGVLMASFGLSAEDAWSVLVDVSQHTNTKLHQLAEELVDSVNGPPLPDHVKQRISTAVAEVSRPA